MKLRYSPLSPYVRKVMVTAHEIGSVDKIEKITTDVWATADAQADNPLGKIPALILDGGEVLYDSSVICEYLDSLNTGVKLFPATGGARWRALRQQALADGIMDAGVLARLEGNRKDGEKSPGWITRQMGVVHRGFDTFEAAASELDGPITIGQITLGCAIGWAMFRYPNEGILDKRPALSRWYAKFSARPSMTATVPKG
ncbi:MAG: glutathione S-transferase [Alphaproteobacteria bacterium]|nr:glutathione S-transferase [Alphaproteobacteria bacterium]